ncbi:TPA: hypothetical protein ACRR1E_003098 [Klebsiella quasipneumoniae]|uniref:hypothetical protein n=1 Tax=Klebsiella quasipneumoniae TaxID=1463165 RepID=UPI002787D15F|nr:hypothetical protein [Klebsiella quasipneumoniae subsp. similipneumoniae]
MKIKNDRMYASLLSYKNLKLESEGRELRSITEFYLYSDSRLTNDVNDNSVYCFLNMLPRQSRHPSVEPSITVRVRWHSDINEMIFAGTKSYTKDFHGGWYNDEIAALSSLLLGVRFHASSFTRHFDYSTGEFGYPQADYSLPPSLSFKNNIPIVPSASKQIDIGILKNLNKSHLITEKNFNYLIKSARSYQNALWICESSPNMGWLLLVSALECAADQWAKSKSSREERFKQAKPDLYEQLDTNEFRHLIPIIAKEFSTSFGATKKFIDFCTHFLPDEPEIRPKTGKIDWDIESLSVIFKKIYDYRSKALHGGQPFPEPMCSHPEAWDGYAERASPCSTLGGTWLADDVPINLNTFNYMVHSILNKWWLSLLPS